MTINTVYHLKRGFTILFVRDTSFPICNSKFICEKVMFFIRSLKLPSWMTFSYNSDGSSKFRLSFALTFWNDFQRNFPISYLSWSLGINKFSLGLVSVGTSRLLGRSPEDVTTQWLKKFSYMVRNWNHWGSCRSFLLNSS